MSADTLYIAQHGLAIDKRDDPERPLSDQGIEQTKAVASHLLSSGVLVSQIFHSGKLRALQTAEIIASTLNVTSVSAIEHLSPNDDVTLTAKNLTINNALYIGHLPHLEKLITYLATDNKYGNTAKFKNSGVACLENSQNGYHIKWYVSPDLLPR